MREYVLTANEREIIRRYIEDGERLEGFSMLLNRCGSIETVNADLELIKKFLAKVEEKKP
jgi:hypothetical protein